MDSVSAFDDPAVRLLRPRNVVDYLAYLVVRVFVCVVQAMPVERCAGVARFLATMCASVLKNRRRLVEENLKHAFPAMTAAERKRLATPRCPARLYGGRVTRWLAMGRYSAA